jgi:hypothetical protein
MNPALWAADYCSQQSSYDTTQDDEMDEPETGGFYEPSYGQNCILLDGCTKFVSTIQIGNCL